MILFRIIKNWFILTCFIRTIKKVDGSCSINRKKLLKKKLNFVKIKLDRKMISLIITSKGTQSYITNLNYIWVDNTLNYNPDGEGGMYQVMYEVFQHVSPNDRKVTLVLDIQNERQIEKFRRILTLYGFYPDISLTMTDLDFKKPWREKESIQNIVYSRNIESQDTSD